MNGADRETPLTVTELTARIKHVLEGGFADIWVTGEISNYKKHTSGHHYFTLKDSGAELPCTLWKSAAARLRVQLADGQKVSVFGDITVYEPRGRYQMNIRAAVPVGVGELERKFRELREKLNSEGLFDQDRKKPLPRFPGAIGLITSPTGAAVRDMISVIHRRMPACRIVLCPVQVQGAGAENEIAEGIRKFNDWGNVDLLIVGRGGGSLEDLWAFNEEIVARAIAASQIPVISAVGHEIDFTISDFVADLRAPTPSAAAELAVPDASEMLSRVKALKLRLSGAAAKQLGDSRLAVSRLRESYIMRRPEELYRRPQQKCDELVSRIEDAMSLRLERLHGRLNLAEEKLAALSPESVLKRGYAICRTYPDLRLVRSAEHVETGDDVHVELAFGALRCRVSGRESA